MKPYPYNLIDDLAGEDNFYSELNDYEIEQELEELIQGLSDRYPVNKHIPKRMQRVLYLQYADGLTLARIAEILGVSNSRVGQIKNKALRMLRHPTRYDRLVHKRADKYE